MTLVLDCEGLSKAMLRDRELTAWLAAARAEDERVVTSAATLVEVVHPRINRPTFDWVLSRMTVEAVTRDISRHAGTLLERAGLHGHQHAIDAMLAATAMTLPGPTTILTSDPDDLTALCDGAVAVVKV